MNGLQPTLQQPTPSVTVMRAFVFTVAALTLLGFGGYYFGFLGFIYHVMMPEAFGSFALVPLAVIFGAAAFFSPCAFTVLPAYVAHTLAADPVPATRRLTRALALGLTAAAGVITVNVLLGLAIAALGSAAPFAKDPRQDTALIIDIRIVAGLLITLMGALTILDRPLPLGWLQRSIPKPSLHQSTFLYGMLYNGAAIGCTGPILLGLILYALSTGRFASAFAAFLVFALTMGALMILLTVATAVFQDTAKTFAPLAPVVKQGAGWVMVVAGFAIALLTLEGNRLFVKIFFPFLQ